jgi:hypothetical protein
MGWEREGTLDWLKNKNIGSVDGVHHTPPPNMFAAVSFYFRPSEEILEEGAQHGQR